MVYSLKEAAQAVGVGKPAILKSIQKGKVSAQKNEHGQWEIDPGELHRVYPSISRSTKGTVSGKQQETTKEMSILEQEVSFLRERLRDKESQIEDLRTERDRLLQVIENQAGTVKQLTQERTANSSQKPRGGFWPWSPRLATGSS